MITQLNQNCGFLGHSVLSIVSLLSVSKCTALFVDILSPQSAIVAYKTLQRQHTFSLQLTVI